MSSIPKSPKLIYFDRETFDALKKIKNSSSFVSNLVFKHLTSKTYVEEKIAEINKNIAILEGLGVNSEFTLLVGEAKENFKRRASFINNWLIVSGNGQFSLERLQDLIKKGLESEKVKLTVKN